ncbi:MAG TPA: STAS domain-containing protein [Thermotogota bacterium]|nr:STAS domain-containing protein [Thermotogota bacterium]HPJ89281.1 STAS domain-containing protein [Thermotogota bacterium]HPR96427.1 STAS domain-containing protein [Thermotogota bacterium]
MNFKVEKELTVYNVEEVMQKIKEGTTAEPDDNQLLLDLTNIEDIDTAGLQLLVSVQKFSDANGLDCRMLITNELKRLFHKYGALEVLEFEVSDGKNDFNS